MTLSMFGGPATDSQVYDSRSMRPEEKIRPQNPNGLKAAKAALLCARDGSRALRPFD
jgi:hypothetical protein